MASSALHRLDRITGLDAVYTSNTKSKWVLIRGTLSSVFLGNGVAMLSERYLSPISENWKKGLEARDERVRIIVPIVLSILFTKLSLSVFRRVPFCVFKCVIAALNATCHVQFISPALDSALKGRMTAEGKLLGDDLVSLIDFVQTWFKAMQGVLSPPIVLYSRLAVAIIMSKVMSDPEMRNNIPFIKELHGYAHDKVLEQQRQREAQREAQQELANLKKAQGF